MQMQLLPRELVSKRMQELHINQTELAKEAECTASMISQFLNGKVNISINLQTRIAEVLGIDFKVDHRLLEKPARVKTISPPVLKSLVASIQEAAGQVDNPENLGRQVADLLREQNLITPSRYTELVGEVPDMSVTQWAG